ncbi:nitronate monooxygenase [Enhydrobacter sp.]|jgi:nitronate monooxygenase|uniref:NAD(P)H-dependent flavin oxidoreductase n=1 Tax=Enhydrobacter sp. TaxID=1894999 RepID=UPI002623CF61|nr:nitronate monooxygenase [Enhydrobacter sp.]WIM12153.1 MAG: putative oxidoreductase, nitronate monooxygenase family [Enhydrobacter sp.]
MARAEVLKLIDRMAMPLIAAPMFLVSNPALALACCSEGIMGSFPAHGTRSREEFQTWLDEMRDGIRRLEEAGRNPAPWAVNLVVHPSNPRYPDDLELVEKYRVPVVLTSKGAPGDAIKRIHGWDAVALHDIANRRHAEKALEAGVDGVIAVAGGAGGHTGTINPFALMNEVRQLGEHFAVVLAGGMSTGRDVLAAEAMGADLAYIGTRFIATREAMAADAHKKMILDTRATDVFLTASIDGAPANWLTPSLLAAGIDLDVLRTTLPGKIVAAQESKKRWKDIYTAGHGVGNIDDVPTAAELCRRLIQQYREAKSRMVGGRAKAAAA